MNDTLESFEADSFERVEATARRFVEVVKSLGGEVPARMRERALSQPKLVVALAARGLHLNNRLFKSDGHLLPGMEARAVADYAIGVMLPHESTAYANELGVNPELARLHEMEEFAEDPHGYANHLLVNGSVGDKTYEVRNVLVECWVALVNELKGVEKERSAEQVIQFVLNYCRDHHLTAPAFSGVQM